ncbi:MAG TPA: glycoside hydrolase family 19 protein [Candidatus Angelobacter sp.]|jgi:putative chitinase|nr:glycoside hydrolase family 19 protein [Candidatus Angelobacter sp.]
MPFNFNFTAGQLSQCVPTNKAINNLFQALSDVLPNYEITSVERVAGFLSQCGHESRDFTSLQENLNYSAARLNQVFPKLFPTVESAQPYVGSPEKIGNKIYANKLGNGPETSGDGYKYRGRGAIQLTGFVNYKAFADAIGKTVDDTVAYCETLQGAVESACWFWKTHGINAPADAKDVPGMTKRINPALLGLNERTDRFQKALAVLGSQAGASNPQSA